MNKSWRQQLGEVLQPREMQLRTVKRAFTWLVVLGSILALAFPIEAVKPRSFEGLIAAAEAIVAVEILSTDYTATAADGPMVAVAKVLKVLKGPLRKGKHIRFTETAWVGPTYRKGEYRILFLEQVKSQGLLRTSPWRILSHLYAKENFFVEEHVVPDLSLETLDAFLRENR